MEPLTSLTDTLYHGQTVAYASKDGGLRFWELDKNSLKSTGSLALKSLVPNGAKGFPVSIKKIYPVAGVPTLEYEGVFPDTTGLLEVPIKVKFSRFLFSTGVGGNGAGANTSVLLQFQEGDTSFRKGDNFEISYAQFAHNFYPVGCIKCDTE